LLLLQYPPVSVKIRGRQWQFAVAYPLQIIEIRRG